MSKLESKIGTTPMQNRPVRHFVVEDPTVEGPQVQQEENPSPQFRRISPEEYNQMRRDLSNQQELLNKSKNTGNSVIFSSTEDVIPDDLGQTSISEDDKNLLNSLVNKNKKTELPTKTKIEVLLGLRKKTASKEIDGHVITLKNLRSNQTKTILESITQKKTGFDKLYATKHSVVAFALDSIDGEKIQTILGEDDSEELRIDLVSNMDPSVVDELYDLYVDKIGNKIAISEAGDSKEVMEEIKKQ